MASTAAAKTSEPSRKEIRLVIGASSAGTVFEWYDFFIYGTLAASGIIGQTFFPSGNETLQTLLAWAGFAIGFGFRPLGAIIFGYLGDRLGRKYTFLVTITLMGVATAGVGLIPSAAAIGLAAPILVILLRIFQGLALGGEYGGAAIYVSEHAPANRRGFYTGFIQASVIGGFVLSLVVVLLTKEAMPTAMWESWGWRIPFLLSILLLLISLWMRLKLSESPVFQAMKKEGEIAGNPFVESFTYPGNRKRIFVALFGVAAGLTVIWYTAVFSALSFLQGPMRVDPTTAELVVGIGAFASMGWYVYFGHLSDRVGRKKPIVWGYAITLLLLFPMFWAMGQAASPNLARAAQTAPVIVAGPDCDFDPFAKEQAGQCGNVLGYLSGQGVRYEVKQADQFTVTVGGKDVPNPKAETLESSLEAAGYDFSETVPSTWGILAVFLCIVGLGALSGATYGPAAALLAEMFPAKIRYSSMSIPYHFGTGYFGGFLPLIASYIVALTGNPYSGLWYTWVIVALALLVAAWGLPSGPPRDFVADDHA